MSDKLNKGSASDNQDSLVDALESIKGLLEKSDAKLAAARESIAIASTQTETGVISESTHEQFEIPVLDDVVTDEDDVDFDELIPTLTTEEARLDPQVIITYLDQVQKQLEKTLRDSLMKSIVTIESGLKANLTEEIEKIRQQVLKDFE